MPSVHDPSTVVRFQGRYYVYSTGRGIPFFSSPDLETWTREGSIFPQIPEAVHAAVPKNNGTDVWAPDIVRVGGQFYLYYAVSSWGSFNSAIALATNPVLDPKDPHYKWTDRGVVVSSDGVEDLNAIDPGVILAPDGTLWICYGSYHGSIRIAQLDPRTGLALKPKTLGQAIATARESEASDIIFHDGFFYLFVNHGSCCKGKDSQYNIRVGRSPAITGPYLDRHQKPLTEGGGSLFLAAHDHRIGPGHFGRLLDYDASPTGAEPDGAEPNGVERFSIHYEADLATGGRPRLDIRPLLWSPDGWPVAGDNLPEATYQILSRQTENTLEEHVPAPPKPAVAAATPTPPELPSPPTLHLTRYLTLDNEKWTIAPTAGGFYKIVNLTTSDAIGVLSASTGATPLALTPYTGADTQQWRLEQLPDGSYAIRNKATGLCLAASDSAKEPNSIVATPYAADDLHRWTITTP
jgi:arabinan endo-1,5-alpha-L-arabinosidase